MKDILIVDDDAAFADLAGTTLAENGFHVRVTKSVEEGLAAAKAQRPDAILVDVKMPGMTGIDFLRSLKKDLPNLHVPVLMVTNDSSLDTIGEATELGIHGYVLKANESMQTIVDSVERLFTKK